MGFLSLFQSGAKYFDKKIDPKCDYCTYGKRTKDGNRVLCEKRGLVEQNYSCKAFIYSPLKRIPVKQLRFVGSIADDDLYIESKGDRTEKEKEKESTDKKANDKEKESAKPAPAPAAEEAEEESPAQADAPEEDKSEAAPEEEKNEAEADQNSAETE
jgi:hypothetical protein